MLAVLSVATPLTDRDVQHGSSAADEDEFIPDFSEGNSSLLLESIDFDDLFAVGGIHDGDVLPDLEMDPPEILADFSTVEDSEIHDATTTAPPAGDNDFIIFIVDGDQYGSKNCKRPIQEEEVSGSGSGLSNKGGEDTGGPASPSSSSVVLNPPAPATKNIREGDKAGRKSTTASTSSASTQGISNKNNHGKRKVKVDWTPELHRRFVQAVEQLGVDKAVPSRILELMGIDCLTRHNVASHLQKYRSHRKHLLAREAEAATWSQRRQVCGGGGGGGAARKRDMNGGHHQKQAWHAPMMGFPPPVTPPPPAMHHHPHPHHLIRPLHVRGHPSMDQSLIHIWPKNLPHHHQSSWTPPPADPSYWHHQRVPAGAAAGVGLTPGTPCFPQPVLPPTRFPTTAVPGIPPPPHSMYKAEPAAGIGGQPQQRPQQSESSSNHLFDIQPSKESIDAAIGDVLSKPWLPLPLGLKPPAVDSVLVELLRQGIPNIPPAASSSSIH